MQRAWSDMQGVRKQPAVSTRDRGLIVVELIIALPIVAIFLAAVIEFGLILVGLQQVTLASRTGAKVAAELSSATITSGTFPTAIQTAVNRVLAAGAIGSETASGNSCHVILRQNVGGTVETHSAGFTCPCKAPTSNEPASPPFFVRVTVCAELSKLSPNLLSSFGFNTANKYVEHTTTYPYEPTP